LGGERGGPQEGPQIPKISKKLGKPETFSPARVTKRLESEKERETRETLAKLLRKKEAN